jgi:hypothetical protein
MNKKILLSIMLVLAMPLNAGIFSLIKRFAVQVQNKIRRIQKPPGSYALTCRNCKVTNNVLTCECKKRNQAYIPASLALANMQNPDIENINGQLRNKNHNNVSVIPSNIPIIPSNVPAVPNNIPESNTVENNVSKGGFVNELRGWKNYLLPSSSTSKLDVALTTLRKAYCLKGCNNFKNKDTVNFPLTDNKAIKQQVQQQNALVAQVRLSSDICNEEKAFKQKRLVHVKQSLQKMLGKELAHVPTIAVCASGGGYRAMIGTLGLYEGLSEQNSNGSRWIDCITYASCLSGSTWFTMPRAMGAPIGAIKDGYKKYSGSLVKNPLNKNRFKYGKGDSYFDESQAANDNIMRLFVWGIPISLPVLYGGRVAHTVLASFDDPKIHAQYNTAIGFPKQSRQQMLISQTKNYIEQSNCSTFPMPIGTMAAPLASQSMAETQKTKSTPYLWAEVTPYEVGFDYYANNALTGAYIPTWASGRKFNTTDKRWFKWARKKREAELKSTNNAPEITAGTFLGIFGSAFNASAKDGLRIFFDFHQGASGVKGVVAKIVNKVLTLQNPFSVFLPGGNTRVFPAELLNHAALEPNSPFYGSGNWVVVDAGVAGNLPFWPLLKKGREVDVIISFDLSDNVSQGSTALIEAERLARNRNIPFPIIEKSSEYAKRTTQWVTVFDQYPVGMNGPIVINLSLVDNPNGKPVYYISAGKQVPFFIKECFKGDCKTSNFDYTAASIDGLSALGKAIAQSAAPYIKASLEKVKHKHV